MKNHLDQFAIQMVLLAVTLLLCGWMIWDGRHGRVTIVSPGQSFLCIPVADGQQVTVQR